MAFFYESPITAAFSRVIRGSIITKPQVRIIAVVHGNVSITRELAVFQHRGSNRYRPRP